MSGARLEMLVALPGPRRALNIDDYEEIFPRLRPGGLVAADNTLWGGEVVSPQSGSAKAIAAFNARVTADARVENVLLSVRDGTMLVRKL